MASRFQRSRSGTSERSGTEPAPAGSFASNKGTLNLNFDKESVRCNLMHLTNILRERTPTWILRGKTFKGKKFFAPAVLRSPAPYGIIPLVLVKGNGTGMF